MATAYDQLFDEYVAELTRAKKVAEAWWDDLVAAETRRAKDPDKALAAVRSRWPVGPASHPCVIAVIRKYYLACERLNNERAVPHPQDDVEEEEVDFDEDDDEEEDEDDEEDDQDEELEDEDVDEVYPNLLVADWLMDDETQDLADFVAVLTYWPIGLDEDSDPI